ncbi:MAG: TIGR03752 family integrating conjugative element protein [Burkholderiales bacterium]|nr:MAG: TIGR03752 family integrating conjugative element protein [Burkholderiales bacterium]
MPAIKQNKLTPILTACGVAICGYVVWAKVISSGPSTVKAGPDLTTVPRPAGDEAVAPRQGGILGLCALSASSPARSADADSPGETLKTVTASNREMLAKVQRVIEDNEDLKRENAKLRGDRSEVVSQVRQEVLAQIKDSQISGGAATPAATPASGATGTTEAQAKGRKDGIGAIVDAATDGYSTMVGSLGKPARNGIPAGLGYDGVGAQGGQPSANASFASVSGAPGSYTRVLPMGYREAKAGDGSTGIVRTNGQPIVAASAPGTHQGTAMPRDPASDAAGGGDVSQAGKKPPKPYFTIPENATLTRATMMTALVGRVPIDGRVQDPMQFKLLIGRENLAANGHYVPDEIAGIVVSGIAVGDMALSCSEGLVQSLTFVFYDGSIQTVSMKKNGAAGGFGGGAGGNSGNQTPSISQSNKLAWLSDEFGNPCITGKFVTNAPAYLTDVVGLKTLSIAAQASALSQTTTSDSPLGATTSVTGSKSKFVLGQAAGAATDEVSNWIMRRLNNSFDAVVTPAGARVVVHIEQEIFIDKAPDARKLNYGRQTVALGGRRALD